MDNEDLIVETDIDDNYIKITTPKPEFLLLTGSEETRLTLTQVKELHIKLGRMIKKVKT